MHNFIENVFLGKELYQTVLTPVCNKYGITHSEMIILLFLANNPQLNTATDIVKNRRLTKSLVSMSVRNLEERGFISGMFEGGNHRSIHLKVCNIANGIIKDAEDAQNNYLEILLKGFNEEELSRFGNYFERISENIKSYYYNIV